jgi:hypothetical protein
LLKRLAWRELLPVRGGLHWLKIERFEDTRVHLVQVLVRVTGGYPDDLDAGLAGDRDGIPRDGVLGVVELGIVVAQRLVKIVVLEVNDDERGLCGINDNRRQRAAAASAAVRWAQSRGLGEG